MKALWRAIVVGACALSVFMAFFLAAANGAAPMSSVGVGGKASASDCLDFRNCGRPVGPGLIPDPHIVPGAPGFMPPPTIIGKVIKAVAKRVSESKFGKWVADAVAKSAFVEMIVDIVSWRPEPPPPVEAPPRRACLPSLCGTGPFGPGA